MPVGVAPHDVADAIVVEVADSEGHVAGGQCSDIDAADWPFATSHTSTRLLLVGLYQARSPDAVAIEVARAERLPAARVRAGVGAACPLTVGNLPDLNMAGRGIEL